ncbi:unnamed protein product [Litomosoides sigmodontis]|uniref:Uncharacterized protein n=1 Tax=Litomosoides sigmodontis TaxID=42156 RepID=A0A3P6V2S6_LITSI|nr:unnamed protein product [Litomosoides sigmodontis]
MSISKWCSTDDDLPPPSMRQFIPSSQFLPRKVQLEEKDRILEERLANLNVDESQNQMETLASLEKRAEMLRINGRSEDTPSVSDIERRLAKLRGIPVENIRYPRFTIVNGNEETVGKLMKRARDEAMLEKEKLEHDVDPEEFLKMLGRDALRPDFSGNLSISDTDTDTHTMGQDTIRNLKEIQQVMKLAKQRSIKAAKVVGSVDSDNHSVDHEIKKLMELTSQSSIKSEKISDELCKFWERTLDHGASSSESSSKSESLEGDVEIDDELQRTILETEEAEMEAKELVKESKKRGKKSGILSRIFHSR